MVVLIEDSQILEKIEESRDGGLSCPECDSTLSVYFNSPFAGPELVLKCNNCGYSHTHLAENIWPTEEELNS